MYCFLMTSQAGSYQPVMELLSLKLGDGQCAVSLAIRHTFAFKLAYYFYIGDFYIGLNT